MLRLFLASLAILLSCVTASAEEGAIQPLLQEHREVIAKSSRKTIGPAIDAIANSGLPQAQIVLETWASKSMWMRKSDGLFFVGEKADSKNYRLTGFDTGEEVGTFPKKELKQLKPNSGVRALIGTALVQFQLLDEDKAKRQAALTSIQRDPEAALLAPLRASIDREPDAGLKAQKQRLERLLTIGYDADPVARIAAIEEMSGDLGVDVRATLNPLVATTRDVALGTVPEGVNVAANLTPGEEGFSEDEAYDLLVAKGFAPARVTADDMRLALAENIEGGTVGGVPVAQLDKDKARVRAYTALAEAGKVPPLVNPAGIQAALAAHVFFETYAEPAVEVTTAAQDALDNIALKVSVNQTLDLTLDALSLASIYFLAAIGLAITFGVMGVINMAHGEFIMMGAYTGYVVQQIIPDHTVSIIVAIPLAFAVTFAAGVAMERLVIRWLYARPLETLLATFGISIALQQLAKNIFGTQARPLTAPGWLDGAWVLNDVVSISYIRIAIFILALIFLCVFLFIMKRTRLGLETRAVTQNPAMAASMGINPGRVNMLTFGLGSGIAGIAGVAIGLFAKVTSELGSDYIVQSFMTVVVGGVGNIWGTLAGATMIGFLQKGIEWLNPSNTLAAQTYMIVFIIIFIQFRPRGIIALKGRAAGD
ncbi:High-affinity branched-chain amino acid transport system permease protein LivH [Falsiruegeria litorea R37]|uniref:High-affinity branched-chain amino acid transport system permease protein LivH n=1 Tax=Falsiruegeria litorea R37 TaxID=1200284 RepID=A0A1Y5SBJ1_9RHOB|nr:urea ABC transporter permease subunit UrtB [Falsiruegeria litorea]SLN35381.1 High-affinity branched-chain amino acid transport system permease protein LivH [Falsiruegeria litorea R37]